MASRAYADASPRETRGSAAPAAHGPAAPGPSSQQAPPAPQPQSARRPPTGSSSDAPVPSYAAATASFARRGPSGAAGAGLAGTYGFTDVDLDLPPDWDNSAGDIGRHNARAHASRRIYFSPTPQTVHRDAGLCADPEHRALAGWVAGRYLTTREPSADPVLSSRPDLAQREAAWDPRAGVASGHLSHKRFAYHLLRDVCLPSTLTVPPLYGPLESHELQRRRGLREPPAAAAAAASSSSSASARGRGSPLRAAGAAAASSSSTSASASASIGPAVTVAAAEVGATAQLPPFLPVHRGYADRARARAERRRVARMLAAAAAGELGARGNDDNDDDGNGDNNDDDDGDNKGDAGIGNADDHADVDADTAAAAGDAGASSDTVLHPPRARARARTNAGGSGATVTVAGTPVPLPALSRDLGYGVSGPFAHWYAAECGGRPPAAAITVSGSLDFAHALALQQQQQQHASVHGQQAQDGGSDGGGEQSSSGSNGNGNGSGSGSGSGGVQPAPGSLVELMLAARLATPAAAAAAAAAAGAGTSTGAVIPASLGGYGHAYTTAHLRRAHAMRGAPGPAALPFLARFSRHAPSPALLAKQRGDAAAAHSTEAGAANPGGEHWEPTGGGDHVGDNDGNGDDSEPFDGFETDDDDDNDDGSDGGYGGGGGAAARHGRRRGADTNENDSMGAAVAGYIRSFPAPIAGSSGVEAGGLANSGHLYFRHAPPPGSAAAAATAAASGASGAAVADDEATKALFVIKMPPAPPLRPPVSPSHRAGGPGGVSGLTGLPPAPGAQARSGRTGAPRAGSKNAPARGKGVGASMRVSTGRSDALHAERGQDVSTDDIERELALIAAKRQALHQFMRSRGLVPSEYKRV